jgi:hypothetical protein
VRTQLVGAFGSATAVARGYDGGDDLHGSVRHLDRGLVVDRVRRSRDPGRPFLHLGQRRVVEALGVEVQAQSEVEEPEPCARVLAPAS